MTSNQTKRLKRSFVRKAPLMPARRRKKKVPYPFLQMIRPISLTAKSDPANPITAATTTMIEAKRSTLNEIPSGFSHPPKSTRIGPGAALMIEKSQTAAPRSAAMPAGRSQREVTAEPRLSHATSESSIGMRMGSVIATGSIRIQFARGHRGRHPQCGDACVSKGRGRKRERQS